MQFSSCASFDFNGEFQIVLHNFTYNFRHLFQTLSHEPQVLKQGLLHLNEVLQSLEPLHKFLDPPGGSVLLRELVNAPNSTDATLSPQATPLLHSIAAAHAYITMFTHVCKVGQVSKICLFDRA